jgi:hypothetical protein
VAFATGSFPHHQANAQATFYIVGNEPRRARALHNGTSVFVTGRVESVIPYVEKAAVVVAPMRTCAGVQNKILESLAIGTPVVTTTMGAEGLAQHQPSPTPISSRHHRSYSTRTGGDVCEALTLKHCTWKARWRVSICCWYGAGRERIVAAIYPAGAPVRHLLDDDRRQRHIVERSWRRWARRSHPPRPFRLHVAEDRISVLRRIVT